MSEQENLKLVQQFYRALKRGDINGVVRTLADDVGWFIPGPKDIVPFVGQDRGRDQVARFIAKFAEIQDAEQFELRGFAKETADASSRLAVFCTGPAIRIFAGTLSAKLLAH